jgi:hypothetical protein
MEFSRMIPIAALLCAAGAGAQSPVHLTVLSTTVDPASRRIVIELENNSSKTVTAYMIAVQQFDAANRAIGDGGKSGLGVDTVCYDAEPYRPPNWNPIQPGAIATFPIGVGALPDAVSAKASVTGVVYADRTAEGFEAAPFFVGRAADAKEAEEASALFKEHPSTPQAFGSTLEKLRAMPHGIGLRVFAAEVHLTGEGAGALFDKTRPLPAIAPLPTSDQWDRMISELQKRAQFLADESQEVRP